MLWRPDHRASCHGTGGSYLHAASDVLTVADVDASLEVDAAADVRAASHSYTVARFDGNAYAVPDCYTDTNAVAHPCGNAHTVPDC